MSPYLTTPFASIRFKLIRIRCKQEQLFVLVLTETVQLSQIDMVSASRLRTKKQCILHSLILLTNYILVYVVLKESKFRTPPTPLVASFVLFEIPFRKNDFK